SVAPSSQYLPVRRRKLLAPRFQFLGFSDASRVHHRLAKFIVGAESAQDLLNEFGSRRPFAGANDHRDALELEDVTQTRDHPFGDQTLIVVVGHSFYLRYLLPTHALALTGTPSVLAHGGRSDMICSMVSLVTPGCSTTISSCTVNTIG